MDSLRTSVTLLERLRSTEDHQAWNRFYDQYWRIILSFAQQRGLDEQAAKDVLQETMVHAMRALPSFNYDASKGKFRNWLLTVARFKILEALRKQRHAQPLAEAQAEVENQAAEPILPGDGDEQEWQRCIVSEALRRISQDPRVKSETFAIFRAYVLERTPIAEVSERFGVKENAIYQIKNRFISRLREETQAILLGQSEAPGEP